MLHYTLQLDILSQMQICLIAAISVDGFIAQDPSVASTTWTSEEDKKWFVEKTKEYGVVVMGRKTYETFQRPLPGRILIILSSSAPNQLNPAELKPSSVVFTSLSPSELVKELATAGFNKLAVGGGASVYTAFVEAGLVDTFNLTIEPIFFGQGVKLFNQPMDQKLKLVSMHQLSDQTVVGEWEKG